MILEHSPHSLLQSPAFRRRYEPDHIGGSGGGGGQTMRPCLSSPIGDREPLVPEPCLPCLETSALPSRTAGPVPSPWPPVRELTRPLWALGVASRFVLCLGLCGPLPGPLWAWGFAPPAQKKPPFANRDLETNVASWGMRPSATGLPPSPQLCVVAGRLWGDAGSAVGIVPRLCACRWGGG